MFNPPKILACRLILCYSIISKVNCICNYCFVDYQLDLPSSCPQRHQNQLFYHPHGLIWLCLETYLLQFLPFCDSFYGYFTYYLAFFRGKCIGFVSRFQGSTTCITPLLSASERHRFRPPRDIVAWANRNVK